MGFDFSKYDEIDVEQEKKPVQRKPKKETESHRFMKEIEKMKDELKTFRKEVMDMIRVKDETILDVWNEILPVLNKMWPKGIFHGRIERLNRMLIDKIS